MRETTPPDNSPLRPVIRPREWYWAVEVRKKFKMSRETVAEVKRQSPQHVIKTRQGDMLRGAAILRYYRSRKATRPAEAV